MRESFVRLILNLDLISNIMPISMISNDVLYAILGQVSDVPYIDHTFENMFTNNCPYRALNVKNGLRNLNLPLEGSQQVQYFRNWIVKLCAPV